MCDFSILKSQASNLRNFTERMFPVTLFYRIRGIAIRRRCDTKMYVTEEAKTDRDTIRS